jgi:hypothetical protein
MMGIGAQRLNPSYEEFFTASVTLPSTEFILSVAEGLRACFFKEGSASLDTEKKSAQTTRLWIS